MSTDQQTSTRTFETTIDIAAPAEAVWRAISEADELMRWFPPEARVTPGAGGKVWMSWGHGIEGESTITIWDPPRRLRTSDTRDLPWSQGEVAGGPVEISVDYFIEARGGTTVLRLVHSGFGRGSAWDNEFDSISNGWKYELRSLKHYLERHWSRERGGELRTFVYEPATALMGRQEAWDLLTGTGGLTAGGAIRGIEPGQRYAVRTAAGDELSGVVIVNNPPRSFVGTTESLDAGLLRAEVEPGEERCGPFISMSLWGESRNQADHFRRQWRGVLDGLFGTRAAPYWRNERLGDDTSGVAQ